MYLCAYLFPFLICVAQLLQDNCLAAAAASSATFPPLLLLPLFPSCCCSAPAMRKHKSQMKSSNNSCRIRERVIISTFQRDTSPQICEIFPCLPSLLPYPDFACTYSPSCTRSYMYCTSAGLKAAAVRALSEIFNIQFHLQFPFKITL